MNYPVIIDFIPWASIKDQLILSRHILDLDVVCRELTLHAVVELPERGVAVRVYDSLLRSAMNSQAFNGSVSSSCLNCPNWSYIKLNPESHYSSSLDPAQAMIVAELGNRLGLLHKQHCLETSFGTCESTEGHHIDPRTFKVQNWKLCREFVAKWPILDCSLGMFRRVIKAFDAKRD